MNSYDLNSLRWRSGALSCADSGWFGGPVRFFEEVIAIVFIIREKIAINKKKIILSQREYGYLELFLLRI